MKNSYISKSEKDTEKIASEFARRLNPGDVVFLIGDLGAGKTTFVRGVAKAIGIKSRILSPTFSLIRSHKVANHRKLKKLHHVDLYRADDADDTVEEILKEFQKEKDGVMLIEWPKTSSKFSYNWKISFDNGDKEKKICIQDIKPATV